MAKACGSTSVACDICNKVIGRRADLARHMKTHASNKEDLMHVCPFPGCKYKALQRSNLATHMNVHSKEKPNRCPAEGCEFASSDPGSLTRHRKDIHGYEPKANPGERPSTIARKEARQRRKISPYTTSSSTSSNTESISPTIQTSGTYESPRPQLPLLVEQGSLPPLPSTDGRVRRGTKHDDAAYNTELIDQLLQGGDWFSTSDTQPGSSRASTSGLLTAPAVPAVGYTSSLDAHAIAGSAASEVNHAALDESIVRFEPLNPVGGPAPTATFLPPLAAEHAVGSALHITDLSTATGQYAVDNAFVDPFYPSAFVPNTWFPNLYLFAALGTNTYSQGPGMPYFFPASAATNVFDTRGFYH